MPRMDDKILLRRYHEDGDLQAREQLIEQYMSLVRSLAQLLPRARRKHHQVRRCRLALSHCDRRLFHDDVRVRSAETE